MHIGSIHVIGAWASTKHISNVAIYKIYVYLHNVTGLIKFCHLPIYISSCYNLQSKLRTGNTLMTGIGYIAILIKVPL